MYFYLQCIFCISAFALANPHHGHSHGDSQEHHHHHSHEVTDTPTEEPVIGMEYTFISVLASPIADQSVFDVGHDLFKPRVQSPSRSVRSNGIKWT